jgi:colicin import membrane protein
MEGLDLSGLFNADGEITVEVDNLPATQTMSLEAVKPQLMEVVQAVDQMVRDAKKIKVDNQQAAQFAVALGGQAKQIAKILKAKEIEVTQKPNEFIKAVRGFCSMFYDQLIANTGRTNTESIELILKKKIGDYQAFIELERQKQEQAARKAQQELQARLDREAEEANRKAREEAAARAKAEAEAKALSEAETKAAMAKAEAEAKAHEVVAPVVPDIVMPKTEAVTRSETGAAAFTKKPWKAEITNPDEVERAFCSPDMKKINEAVKAGIREMKGVRIYQDQQVNFRS